MLGIERRKKMGTLIGLLLYIGGYFWFTEISDPEIASWGFFIFLVGMLFHWKFWGLVIAGATGGYLLSRD